MSRDFGDTFDFSDPVKRRRAGRTAAGSLIVGSPLLTVGWVYLQLQEAEEARNIDRIVQATHNATVATQIATLQNRLDRQENRIDELARLSRYRPPSPR